MLSYNKAILHGGALVDYLWIKSPVDTQNEINEINNYYYSPIWSGRTFLIATFDENINGGNIVSLSDSVINWQVYRTSEEAPILEHLITIPVFQNKVLDFGVVNNKDYQYTLFAETENYISAPMPQAGTTKTSWETYSLSGVEQDELDNELYYSTGETWILNSNLSTGTLQSNLAKNIFEPFTRFPKVTTGKTDYITSSLEAMLGNIDITTGEYSGDTAEKVKQFQRFIANGKPKLLKDRKGLGYLIDTMSCNVTIDERASDLVVNVAFDYVQIADINDITIVGL